MYTQYRENTFLHLYLDLLSALIKPEKVFYFAIVEQVLISSFSTQISFINSLNRQIEMNLIITTSHKYCTHLCCLKMFFGINVWNISGINLYHLYLFCFCKLKIITIIIMYSFYVPLQILCTWAYDS